MFNSNFGIDLSPKAVFSSGARGLSGLGGHWQIQIAVVLGLRSLLLFLSVGGCPHLLEATEVSCI